MAAANRDTTGARVAEAIRHALQLAERTQVLIERTGMVLADSRRRRAHIRTAVGLSRRMREQRTLAK